MTVCGPVETGNLGHTWMHEHLFTSSMGVALSYPQLYRPDYLEQAEKDLNEMKQGGISTMVEATTVALGRDVRSMKKVSEKTGVNVIASTGWWGVKPTYLSGDITVEQWTRGFIDAQMPDRFLFIKKHVFPALAELGMDPDYLWRLTEENPRRFFEQ